jgi:glutamyl-tRNA reductase
VSVVVVGANHRTAPLDLLERMVVSGDRLPKLLHDLDGGSDVSEVVVLSTCNRTEVYLVAERFHGAYSQVRDFFSDLTYLPPDLFADSMYVHYDDSAVRHLFEVAAGLDSAVPGEHEILGQVRDAWEAARAEGTARRGLNQLFRQALEVGKRARTETRIARHVTSISQAAVILAGMHLGGTTSAAGAAGPQDAIGASATAATPGLRGRRAVLVGAGTMARGMASFLVDAGVAELVITNRTAGRAQELAESLSDRMSSPEQPTGTLVRAAGLDELGASLGTADVLLTATNATTTVVQRSLVAASLEGREHPLLVVDVGVPRDVDPSVVALDGVEVLDMDAVAAMTEANLAARHAEADAVRGIVAEEVDRYGAAVSAREVTPVVTALREQAERLRQAELERFSSRLDSLDPEQREAVDALTRGMLAKLLHSPTVRLKDAAGSGRGDRLADSVRDLFDLG